MAAFSSRVLFLEVKGRLYSACVRSVIRYASEAGSVKGQEMIRIRRDDANMVGFQQRNVGLN